MAGIVPAIHGLHGLKNVDARDKPGHDDQECDASFVQARNETAPYRIGGAYCTPPAFHSWFIPRGIFSLDFSPMLRSYISP